MVESITIDGNTVVALTAGTVVAIVIVTSAATMIYASMKHSIGALLAGMAKLERTVERTSSEHAESIREHELRIDRLERGPPTQPIHIETGKHSPAY